MSDRTEYEQERGPRDIYWVKAQIEKKHLYPWQDDTLLINNGWIEVDRRDDTGNIRNSFGALTFGHVSDWVKDGEKISMYISGYEYTYTYRDNNRFPI
jgi:hypothetical protein